MAITYNRTNWRAGEEGGTPINPTNLNNIENGIEQATNQINQNSEDIEQVKTARGISYDNSTSGLDSDNVQSAIDELSSIVEIADSDAMVISKKGSDGNTYRLVATTAGFRYEKVTSSGLSPILLWNLKK